MGLDILIDAARRRRDADVARLREQVAEYEALDGFDLVRSLGLELSPGDAALPIALRVMQMLCGGLDLRVDEIAQIDLSYDEDRHTVELTVAADAIGVRREVPESVFLTVWEAAARAN